MLVVPEDFFHILNQFNWIWFNVNLLGVNIFFHLLFSYGSNNAANYGSMYSAVVSASSTSPTNSEGPNIASSKTDLVYPPLPKLKSSPILKDPLEDTLPRSPPESSGGGGPYNPLV